MEFNEKNMMNILSKATKPMGMIPAFVIIDDHKTTIESSMGSRYTGDRSGASTATIFKEKGL